MHPHIRRGRSRVGLALVFLSVLLAPVAVAQTSGGGGGGPPPLPPPSPQPGPLSDAEFTAVAAGEFNGDLDPDVMLLDAGIPTLLLSPETLRTSLRAGVPAVDLATLPGGAPGGHDAAVIVGYLGLMRLHWDPVELEWGIEQLDLDHWGDAKAVAVGQLDGADGLDIAGIAEDGGSVLTFLEDGSGGYEAGPSIDLAGNGYDVLLLDWDGLGTDEVAALTTSGIEIYELDGTPVTLVSWSSSSLRAAVVRDDERDNERLVVTVRVGSTDYMRVLGSDGLESIQVMGNLQVASIAAWDRDGDGDTDLAFGLRSQPSLMRLTYRKPSQITGGSTLTFLLASYVFLPYGDQGRDPSLNQAGLGVADFDHDGNEDILAPVQGDWSLGGNPTGTWSDVEIVSGDPDAHAAGQVVVEGAYLDGNPEDPTCNLVVSLGAPEESLEGSGDLLVELTVWYGADMWEPADPVPHVATVHVDPAQPVVVAVTGADVEGTGLYAIVLREVRVDQGVVVAVGPATVTTYAGVDSFSEAQQQPSVEESFTITLITDGEGRTDPVGGMVTGPTAPRFEDDAAPR